MSDRHRIEWNWKEKKTAGGKQSTLTITSSTTTNSIFYTVICPFHSVIDSLLF